MQMTVKTGFCDAASFTKVMRLCHGGHPFPTDTFLVIYVLLWWWTCLFLFSHSCLSRV